MPDDPRILDLLEEAMTTESSPESLCSDAPELLAEVRRRLARVHRLRSEMDALFPEAGSDDDPPAPATAIDGLPRIPGHEVEALIGEGGMGVVYRARHARLNRPVAVKMLRAGAYAGPPERARFQREVEAIAALRHENIVRIYDVGDLGDAPYFTMELVEGGSLVEYLAGTPRPARQAAALLVPLARAVQFAHERGIVHRDLKPANILLETTDRAHPPEPDTAPGAVLKISDFGLAKLSRRPETPRTPVTRSGAILGTPAYIAPEQARGHGAEVGPAADIYSLGVILYEALTGRPPFLGADPVETLVQAAQAEPVPPARLVPDMPADLQTICLKCLEKEPQRRYPTAGALADDLERFLAHEPIHARPAGRLERGRRWVRRHQGLSAALAVAALLLAALVGGSIFAAAHFRDLGREQHQLATAMRRLALEADATRAVAEDSERREAGLRRRAEEQGELIRRDHYLGQMYLAGQAALDPGGLGRVGESLTEWESGPRDLRGWEWYYLKGLCHRDLATFRGHRDGVFAAAWSPDGRRIASAGGDGDVGLWDPCGDGGPTWLRGHAGAVASVAWSPDGARLASAGGDGTIRVWDAARGRPSFVLRGHDGGVPAVAWSPDGTRLASGGDDRTVRIWAAAAGAVPRVLRGHQQGAAGVAWSPDGRRVASAGRDATIRLWDPDSGEQARTLAGHIDWVNRVAWSPDGARLASASRDTTVMVWDPAAGRVLLTLRGHGQPVRDVAWSPDGTRLVSAGDDQSLRVWPAPGGGDAVAIRGHTFAVTAAAWSPDGARLVSASSDGTLKVWDGRAGPETPALPGHRVAWSRGARPLLASADTDGTLTIRDLERGEVRSDLRGHEGPVLGLAWDPDGVRLASAGQDRVIRIWDVPRGAEIARLTGHGDSVVDVAWSPDGRRLASAGMDRAVRIWDVANGRCVQVCDGHGLWIHSVAWSPDGRRVAGALWDATVRVWDAATGREERLIRGHTACVRAVAWSPDGRWLASCGDDQTIRLTDAATGRAARTLRGHTAGISAVAWSPGGTRLASAGADRTARVWDVATGRETLGLGGHAGGLTALDWSPDGMALATAGEDRTILIHDATAGYLAARAPACLSRLDRRLAAEPGDRASLKLRAEVRANLGDWDAAAADARKCLELERSRPWLVLGGWVAGPYPADLEASYPPERETDPAAAAARESTLRAGTVWRPVPLGARSFVNLGPLYDDAEQISAYVLFKVYSSEEQAVGILLGSDDQVRLWLNGHRIFEHLSLRVATADEDAVPAVLRPGWNTLLARVANETGRHALYLRISDPADVPGRARRETGTGQPP